jgi:hypothetical protein
MTLKRILAGLIQTYNKLRNINKNLELFKNVSENYYNKSLTKLDSLLLYENSKVEQQLITFNVENINEIINNLIKVFGDYSSIDIVDYRDENIPDPPHNFSGKVLKIVIRPNSSIVIFVDVRILLDSPFKASFIVLSKESSVTINTLFSNEVNMRTATTLTNIVVNTIPQIWTSITFNAINQTIFGKSYVGIRVVNNSSSSVSFYINLISISIIDVKKQIFSTLYEFIPCRIVISPNTPVEYFIPVMLPSLESGTYIIHFSITISKPANQTATITLLEMYTRYQRVVQVPENVEVYTAMIDVFIKLTYDRPVLIFPFIFILGIESSAQATISQIYVCYSLTVEKKLKITSINTSINARSTNNIFDGLRNMIHTEQINLTLSAPSDGSLILMCDDVPIMIVPPNSTNSINVQVNCNTLSVQNTGSSSGSVHGYVIYSQGILT